MGNCTYLLPMLLSDLAMSNRASLLYKTQTGRAISNCDYLLSTMKIECVMGDCPYLLSMMLNGRAMIVLSKIKCRIFMQWAIVLTCCLRCIMVVSLSSTFF